MESNETHRLQSFLRENARHQYDSVAVPPFTLFFHPADTLKYFNYAIPDQPVGDEITQALERLGAEFRRRGRVPRFEFFESFAPELPDALRRAGFVEEARQWSMVCTPQTFRHAPVVPDLQIVPVLASSPDEEIAAFIDTQRRGFGPDGLTPVGEADITQARESFRRGWNAFLGRLNGAPAGVTGYSTILDGICEVGGVATLDEYRRRGIASFLTAKAMELAFEQGASLVCLTAEDERAGRVYERIGFRPFSIMLAYIHGGE